MNRVLLRYLVASVVFFSLFATVQAATVLFPSGGGTGNGTNPTYGQMLVGNSGGTYSLLATSSLGITTGGFAFPFTPSLNFGVPTNATTSPLWLQNGLQASTTSQFDQIDINSNSATAFAVGYLGTTSNALIVNNSTANASDGLSITGGAINSQVVLQVIGGGAAEDLDLNSKGTGNVIAKVNGTTHVTIANTSNTFANAFENFTYTANNAAATAKFSVVNPTDTALTASTEAPDVYFNLGATTRTHATGSYALQRDFRITGSTHVFATGGGTITDAAAFSVDAPIAGNLGTFTNAHAIYVPSRSVITGTGVATNSYGLTVNAQTGATNNYAAEFLGGNVGVGSTTPGSLLSVGGNASGTNFFDNATTTKNGVGGFNIAQGCFAIAGVCLSSSGVSAISVASANGFGGSSSGGSTPALTLTTSVTGLLKGNGTAISAAALTDFPAIAANTVLANNTSGSTAPTAIATSSLFQNASGTNSGLLTSTDWTTFNNKGSGTVTSVTGTYPVQSSGGTTPAISLAFGTTTPNTWSALQTFSGSASTTKLTSNIFSSGQTGTTTILSTGFVGIGTSSPSSALSFGLASSSIAIPEYSYGSATSTSELVDCRSGSQTHIRIGTSATALQVNASSLIPGQKCIVIVENPNAVAGAITWTSSAGAILLWAGGTAPTQTTAATKMDVWSFLMTTGSSTNALLGAASTNF